MMSRRQINLPENNFKRILIRNTSIKVMHATFPLHKTLEKALTEYDMRNAFPTKLWSAIFTQAEPDGSTSVILPRFIPKGLLKAAFPAHSIEYDSSFWSLRENNISCSIQPRDENQANAFKFLLDETGNNPFSTIRSKGLALKTGMGKTFLSIKYTAEKKLLPNIFIHKVDLFESPWKKDLCAFLDITPNEIALVQGADSFERVMRTPEKFKCIVTSSASFSAFLKSENEINFMKEFYETMGIGINIIDECHLEQRTIALINAFTNPKYTLYMSATPERTDFSSMRVFRTMIDVDSFFGTTQGEIKVQPYINILIDTYKTTVDPDILGRAEKFTGVDLCSYYKHLVSDGMLSFYQQVKKYLDLAIPKQLRVCIIVENLKAIDELHLLIQNDFPNNTIGKFTAEVKKSEKMQQLTKDIVLSTAKSLNAGTDTVLHIMIANLPISSPPLIEQLVGRLRFYKDHPSWPYLFIDMVDTGWPKVKRQLPKRKLVLKKRLAKTIKVVNDS